MKRVFIKYIAIAVALFATAMTAQAQYHNEGGVSTAKNVSGPDDDGFYTITLESFATGTTTVTETATPVNVVLVLDVSGSMAWPKGDYTQSTKTSYSYNDIVNGEVEYFRRYNRNSDYIEKIYVDSAKVNNQTRYYLYISPDNGTGNNQGTYLTENGGTTTGRNNAAYATTKTAAIVTPSGTEGNGWNAVQRTSLFFQGTSRIKALQDGVCAFIQKIEDNDHLDESKNERDERLHNKVSIVKFAGDGNNTSYNNNETIITLQNTEGNFEDMKAAVKALMPKGATEAGEGMRLANIQLQNADAGANKVVVMFTDGEPSDNFAAITQSRTTKGARGAIVYTIGTFTESPARGSVTYNYLNAVSSNYGSDVAFTTRTDWDGTVTALNITGTGTMGGTYYKDASGNVDLKEIFEAIAEGIGGSTEEIGATTQVRDVVSNSFVIPDGTTASDVKVYTANALTETTWGTRAAYNNATITFVDANGNKITPKADGSVAGAKSIYVEGFDFSKDDTSEGAGDGNWVGQRFNQSHNPKYFWAGKKLIIELKIKANGEATGGTGTATNESTSGVYIKNEDGTYTPINHYDVPHTTLTTTIKIKKTGLRIGESATFEIMKIRPKGWDESKTLEENIANIEYNIIGKPLPNSQEYTGTEELTGSDLYKKMGWSSFSKVILTNKSETNGGEVVKILRALDPYWVYMVLEDDWGWAYDMSGNNAVDPTTGETTTSMVELNPFSFHNTEKTDVPKHAEAVTINHFGYTISGGAFNGKQEEHYKSSKVKSF